MRLVDADKLITEFRGIIDNYDGLSDISPIVNECINKVNNLSYIDSKSIPMKPIHITGDDCPNCNYSVNIPYLIGRMKMKYCRNCGQAIDWNE